MNLFIRDLLLKYSSKVSYMKFKKKIIPICKKENKINLLKYDVFIDII